MSISGLSEMFEGKIDFMGQHRVDILQKYTLVGAAIVAFIIGFAAQSLALCFSIYGFCVVVLALVVLPPWPIWNKNAVQWLPVEKKAQ